MKRKKKKLTIEEKLLRPTMPILLTLVCLGPYANLIFDVATNGQYRPLLKATLLSFPTIAIISASWILYYKDKREEKEKGEEYYKVFKDE